MPQSPLNYTGGKFKLLPQILPLFPQNVHTFVDLFCGGGDVGANVQSQSVLFNDKDPNVIGILRAFNQLPKEETLHIIRETIEHYRLSDTSVNDYAYYGCNSAEGVGSYNREPFMRLREDFNQLERRDHRYYILLYVLVVYSFNNQIRFNRNGQFNLPVGKRDFNRKMQAKLDAFIDRLQEMDSIFSNVDFRALQLNQFGSDDFIYADPPYLITCATYNEQGGWTEKLERALYNYLNNLHAHGGRFALSNVLTSKGKTNSILQEWLTANPQYTCHHLHYDYSNSSYQTNDRVNGSDEVLITNY